MTTIEASRSYSSTEDIRHQTIDLNHGPNIVAIMYRRNPIHSASIDKERTDIDILKGLNNNPSHKNKMIANRRRM